MLRSKQEKERGREREKAGLAIRAKNAVLSSVLSFGTSYLLAAKSQTALTASYYGAHCLARVTPQRSGLHGRIHTYVRPHTKTFLQRRKRAFLAGASKK